MLRMSGYFGSNSSGESIDETFSSDEILIGKGWTDHKESANPENCTRNAFLILTMSAECVLVNKELQNS